MSEYLNPTSIAGMFNVTKDNGMPGAGYGGFQGFLEGQATRQAEDFLNMSKAKAAQDFVKTQWDNQTKFEDRPFEIQKREEDLKGTQVTRQKTELENKKMEKILQQLEEGRHMDAVRHYGSAHKSFLGAKSPLEQKQLWDYYIGRHKALGYPTDESINYDGSSKSWNHILKTSELASQIASYSDKIAAERAMKTESEAGSTSRNTEDNATQLEITNRNNAAARARAKINAEAHVAAQSGTNGWNQYRAAIAEKAEKALIKLYQKQPLTPEEEAYIDQHTRVNSATWAGNQDKMDPQKQGAVSAAKKGGELRGVLDTIHNVQESPESFAGQSQPQQTDPTDLRSRLNRYIK